MVDVVVVEGVASDVETCVSNAVVEPAVALAAARGVVDGDVI